MKATGNIEIESGLVLNSPKLTIKTVIYDWENHLVSIECLFNEVNSTFKHSRSYEFTTDGSGELTSDDILNLIKSHNVLKVFN